MVYIIDCISWTIKYFILLMHDATMKINNYSIKTTLLKAASTSKI